MCVLHCTVCPTVRWEGIYCVDVSQQRGAWGGGGAIAPPSPLKLKLHSILCMGVLGDTTISTAVHQVVTYGHVFHRWQRAWQDHLKRLNSKYTDSPSLFSTTFRVWARRNRRLSV